MKEEKMNNFNTLNIDADILKGLQKKQYEEMTEVQENVIPLALAKMDIIAQAPTGTGKTAAYAIPVLQNIDRDLDRVQALILAPTRELAVQITAEIKEMAFFLESIRVVAVYGGEYIERQITSLRRRPQIIVATPGRLMDHMRRNTIKLNDISMLVLDEADEMLNMGFREDIDTILESIDCEHQTMLFSATVSKDIESIAKTYLKDPKIIRVNKNEMNVPTIAQRYIEVREKDKIEVMSRIIDINDYQLVMVFCNTKRMVDEVTSNLLTRGFLVEALHGDMKQMQRDRVMNRFRNRTLNVLVASDVAARGLDIDDVDVVFNYDVPTDEEYYVHRVGRTGRAKKEGLAITLITKNDKYRLRGIMAYSHAAITAMEVPSLDKVMTVRVDRIIKQALESNDGKYKDTIKTSIDKVRTDEFDPNDLITGLIMLQLNADSDVDIKEESSSPKAGYSRIFFGMGRKDNLQVFQLTELVMQKTTLTNRDINKIDMHENFSFFEIPSNKVDELVFAFSGSDNGKKILVEEAKDKPRGSGDRGSRSDRSSRYSDRKPFGESSSRGSSRRDSDRPRRDFSDRPRGEFSDRPRRDFGDAPKRDFSDRPRRDFSDRPKRDFGDAPKRDFNDRPKRDFGDAPKRDFSDRPKRDFNDRPRGEFSDRPKRDFGDAPKRDFSDRPKRDFSDRPKREFSNSPRVDSSRPKREFSDRPIRSSSDRPINKD
jgi:ATP-dependent RNA helicase DeaD